MSKPRWDPYRTHIGPIWASQYETHVNPGCTSDAGSLWAAQMGPIWVPIWDPYTLLAGLKFRYKHQQIYGGCSESFENVSISHKWAYITVRLWHPQFALDRRVCTPGFLTEILQIGTALQTAEVCCYVRHWHDAVYKGPILFVCLFRLQWHVIRRNTSVFPRLFRLWMWSRSGL